MSIIANFLPEPMTSKCASLRTSSYHQMRSYFLDKIEDRFPENSTPEEKAWIERLIDVTERVEEYHSTKGWKALRLLNKQIELPSMEEEKVIYRERWATFRLICKIEDVARRMIDENVDDSCQVFYLTDRLEKLIIHEEDDYSDLEIINYDQCWQSLLKLSEQPLAYKLRDKLNEAGIMPATFSQSISKIYLGLQSRFHNFWCLEIVDFGPDDIKGILNNMGISDTEYECIKILFNLEEREKWQIKDCEKCNS